jgi:hypothetical protein
MNMWQTFSMRAPLNSAHWKFDHLQIASDYQTVEKIARFSCAGATTALAKNTWGGAEKRPVCMG